MAKRYLPALWTMITSLEVIAFIASGLWRVYVWGLHAADDGYFAVVAKNLATGWGYATTIPFADGKWTRVPFDVYTTTGPVLILPTALFVRMFGNKYWVPGFSTVVCWSILLILIGLLARRYNAGLGLALATLTFLFLDYATPWFSGLWYAMLGEIPTALLIILAVFLYFHSETRTYRILTGVTLGLAMLTKTLAAGALPGFLAAIGCICLARNWHNRTREMWMTLIRSFAYLGIGLILPLVLFEGWKLVALGPALYIQRVQEARQVVSTYGVSSSVPANLVGLYQTRIDTLLETYTVWLPGVMPMLAFGLYMIRNDDKLKEMFLVLASIIFVYTVWWLFFSIGWPRYYAIPIALIFATLALPFLQGSLPTRLWLPYALVIALWSTALWPRLSRPFGELGDPNSPGRQQTEALLETAHMLQQAVAQGGVIVTQQWTTAADLEYIMDSHLNFTNYTDQAGIGTRPFLIAINTRWWDRTDENFAAMLENCTQRQKIGQYLIAHCPPLAAP